MSFLSELQVGDSLEEIILSAVSKMDLIKYSEASGDFNPINTIDVEAKEAGLPAVIAHGMWSMGNLSKIFTPYYGEGFIQDFQVRFLRMVFINDILTLKAKLIKKNEGSSIFQVSVTNRQNMEVLKGKVEFAFYRSGVKGVL